MKTKQRLASFIIIAMFLSLLTAITIIAIPDKPFAVDAESIMVSPFVGEAPHLTLEQKASAINYPANTNNTPMLTIFIPDVNEDASAWSNNYFYGGFSYDEKFLPERIESTYGNAEIYTAKYQNSQLYVARCKKSNYEIDATKFKTQDEITSFSSDANKHRIILLSFNNPTDIFSTAYTEVNKLITFVLYDLKVLTNLNATVNIIGHGRGGLLGIKYANEHPTAVNALFNIGTPHNGSDTLKLLQVLKNRGIDISKVEELLGGSSIYEFADGNSSLLCDLKNDWNNNTIAQNPYIKAYAFGGVTDHSHFEKIGNMLTLFSDINDETNLSKLLELLVAKDANENNWASEYLGDNEDSLLQSLNAIKMKLLSQSL